LDVVQRNLVLGGNVQAFCVVDVGKFWIGKGPSYEGFGQLLDGVAGTVRGGEDVREIT
jgi:hypothetical protein